VVGGDAEIRVAVLQHLENGLQHTDDRAVRAVFAFVEPAQTVEVAEQLVSPVDEMYHVKAFAHVAVGVKGFATRG